MIYLLKAEMSLLPLCMSFWMTQISLFTWYIYICSQVLEIMAGARGEDLYSLAQAMYQNTNKLFKF